MTITETCDILRCELYQNGYTYGFYSNGTKYTPDFSNGFDEEFFNLQKMNYHIQEPQDTMQEKIGTCIDAVMVMKTILDQLNIRLIINVNIKLLIGSTMFKEIPQ